MTTREFIASDPSAFVKVLETPAGTAWYVPDMDRYVMELAVEQTAGEEEDSIASKELWTNVMDIVRTKLGGPAPGEQVDLFKEAMAWGP